MKTLADDIVAQHMATDAPDVWDDSLPPGGQVCGECGQPTESEPCGIHQPRAAYVATGECRWHQDCMQTGAITATVLHPGRSLLVQAGGALITVQATPMGQRVYVTIEDGRAFVQTARRTRDGRWQ